MSAKPTLETILERGLFASRWLMAPMYVGLVIALAALVVIFFQELIHVIPVLLSGSASAEDAILLALALIDLSLAGNLVLIVIFSGYENFVSKLNIGETEDRPSWMGTVDFSGLKMKLVASIVAISAIALLKANGVLPSSLPVYLDSPMAIHTTGLFAAHLHGHRLNAAECDAMERVATMTVTPDESRAIAHHHGPKVILSASGMATGGRVLHHLAQHLGDHRNMVLLTGFQAPGTRGDRLAQGEGSLRIHGHDVPVRAEVVQLSSSSAHADATQLMQWLSDLPAAPLRVFVTHGEMAASDALRLRIQRQFGWPVSAPDHDSTWQL
jgi:uncharacterized protein (TIGR00645 family)